MPAQPKLIINVGGSALVADWDNLKPWRALLDCADSIVLHNNDAEAVTVELGGLRRWIAIKKTENGSPLYCVGYQETVGAITRDNIIRSGSNRKVLAWLRPSGQVYVGDKLR